MGVGIVGFGVLLSGVLGGSATEQKISVLSHFVPPSAFENLNQNFSLTDKLQQIADEKEATLAQLAIAWVLAQGEDIMALVGSRTESQFKDSLKATDIRLSKDDLDRIESIIPKANALITYMPPVNIDKNGLFKR
ncbi:reductase [Bacteroides reticulotermitis JCM 10512]|uniref:Reductase n=1 Tax=Bacteroides reticulotermitis JCM 10512 TaxID=1445607 RepID=W4UWI4_9BACE|nr:reductase [Bacteroides reticulotermitis JCM 10512]